MRRAVVTGIGVVAPTGIGVGQHWKATLAGQVRTGRISLFDADPYEVTLAGEVSDFDALEWTDNRRTVQTDRWTHLAFAGTRLALDDAALPPTATDPDRYAVALASNSGGNLFGQRELQRLWSRPARTVGAYQSIAWFYAASVGQLSIAHQFKGACGVLVAEAAGGLDSLAHAARTIRRGADVVLAGATECALSPYALACQMRNGLLSTGTDPERAYLPFDVDAGGYLPGEGGAVLVVEELGHALARGAPVIYGEVSGWGASHDAAHTGRHAGGDVGQYARAMRLALAAADVRPDQIDVCFPDALGVPRFDAAEVRALRAVCGPHLPPVTTQKPLTGRAHQGSAALDVATALLALRHRLLPPTAAPRRPAPGCDLDFVRSPTEVAGRAALVTARGFDGFNSALVLTREPGWGDVRRG
ncbi:beta-ketoacyl synthase N-terminal-like domain-containing protein [Solwaraspora sp. WMMD406]|uniref:beta-ketoacyl synthase N-terminal-like domain-containing protein n=1 Tax=Solwaraspora sp. WMMD406 TaxID=3016095 RepID=UPI002415F0C0|nr:beta-ketoacyl synthase N-terminal-like domain-containing protein [Solwaraspora sp. WMMD406]MDG4764055.1 beta-ketoacyl synthase N-terminal-like domain-containing protein [Solwaraspora sp. WMMD406]